MSLRGFDTVAVGDTLPVLTVELDRAALVAYAAASGDHNAIHWSDRVAQEVGLPGVIAHGMLTMGVASRTLTEWAGEPTAVVAYSTRFTRPVVVPDPGVVVLEVSGSVRSTDADAREVVVDLTVGVGGETVLTKTRATLRLA
ncbi:MaoC/PaaZ C-terminal domain-containing protein [Aquipuribacter nitratireducens]|uniref:MaoC/PaaZ C-terminal domain-containing protein n=1 Tax=Aquipuribacter nitratireducens TaxID=650104 RepID=A0ABW0GHH2_9MICO